MLDLAGLARQIHQLLAFVRVQQLDPGDRIALGLTVPPDSRIDAVGMAAKLLGQISGLEPSVDKFDHLLAKLRRVRHFWLRHTRTPFSARNSVREKQATPESPHTCGHRSGARLLPRRREGPRGRA